MKVSDYIVSFLEDKGVRDVFLLAGGGMMHLLDSLAKKESIQKIYMLHEQGAGFAADGYAQCSNRMGVAFVTTGPGATNVVTPVASAYIDSTPMLIVSGQVKTADLTRLPGVRQTGAQETTILPIVDSITKYAVTVENPSEIRYHMEKAYHLALHDRPGPVWLDIPLDVQSADVDPESLCGFEPQHASADSAREAEVFLDGIMHAMAAAERPCLLVGTGVFLADAEEAMHRAMKALGIPVLSSRRVRRMFREGEDSLYFGGVGLVAPRYANYILQNCDFLLCVGSGLRYYMTVYAEGNFAPKAKKFVVNVAKPEIEKLRMKLGGSLVADAKDFLERLAGRVHTSPFPKMDSAWLSYCKDLRDRYPAEKEAERSLGETPDGYRVAMAINRLSDANDVFFQSPSAFAYTYNTLHIREDQDYVCPVGLGSMGTALPGAIGACIASGKRVIVGDGDGSLQLNLQELAILRTYHLPIKFFVDTNGGYRQIRTMQMTHFAGRLAGCDASSGLAMPSLEKLAEAYGLRYHAIRSQMDIEHVVCASLSDDEPAIIEIFSDMETEFIPIVKSRMGADGRMVSPSLDDMYPFLPRAEHHANEWRDES